MKVLGIVALAGLCVALPATAAEPIGYGVASTADAVPVAADLTFDWNGFYAGVMGGLVGNEGDAGFGASAFAGVNTTFDFYLAGAEVAVAGSLGQGGTDASVDLLARGGLLVTDDLAVYALAGLGFEPSDSEAAPLLGAGVELAVTEDLTIRGQYVQGFEFGSDEPVRQVTVGAAFHF